MPDFPEIFMLRHGQTLWNLERRLQGRKNSDLTDLGREQAKIQGRILQQAGCGARGLPVVASPLQRAAETARIAAANIGSEISFDPRLTELNFGDWEGRTVTEVAAEAGGDIMTRELTFDQFFSAPGGERYAQVEDRVRRFLERLNGPAIIVTHLATGRILRGVWLGLARHELATLPADQGCVYHLKSGAQTTLFETSSPDQARPR